MNNRSEKENELSEKEENSELKNFDEFGHYDSVLNDGGSQSFSEDSDFDFDLEDSSLDFDFSGLVAEDLSQDNNNLFRNIEFSTEKKEDISPIQPALVEYNENEGGVALLLNNQNIDSNINQMFSEEPENISVSSEQQPAIHTPAVHATFESRGLKRKREGTSLLARGRSAQQNIQTDNDQNEFFQPAQAASNNITRACQSSIYPLEEIRRQRMKQDKKIEDLLNKQASRLALGLCPTLNEILDNIPSVPPSIFANMTNRQNHSRFFNPVTQEYQRPPQFPNDRHLPSNDSSVEKEKEIEFKNKRRKIN